MRSVVVVLPASICALMPMFRYLSIGVLRATLYLSFASLAPSPSGTALCLKCCLEPVVRERLVRFRHAVHFFALLDGAAAPLGRFHQLAGQAGVHGLLAALLRRFAQPAHGQRRAPRRAHF